METDLKLYYMKLRRENQLHRHIDAHLQRERALPSMRASIAYKNPEVQRGSLQESTYWKGLSSEVKLSRFFNYMEVGPLGAQGSRQQPIKRDGIAKLYALGFRPKTRARNSIGSCGACGSPRHRKVIYSN